MFFVLFFSGNYPPRKSSSGSSPVSMHRLKTHNKLWPFPKRRVQDI